MSEYIPRAASPEEVMAYLAAHPYSLTGIARGLAPQAALEGLEAKGIGCTVDELHEARDKRQAVLASVEQDRKVIDALLSALRAAGNPEAALRHVSTPTFKRAVEGMGLEHSAVVAQVAEWALAAMRSDATLRALRAMGLSDAEIVAAAFGASS